jgi:hypothetical protein
MNGNELRVMREEAVTTHLNFLPVLFKTLVHGAISPDILGHLIFSLLSIFWKNKSRLSQFPFCL